MGRSGEKIGEEMEAVWKGGEEWEGEWIIWEKNSGKKQWCEIGTSILAILVGHFMKC